MREKDQWYKGGIWYALDIETFQDTDGDGNGDFQGLIGRLDYLATLGITCIWILPFYPSPFRDNGYDVMDYYNVDKRFGTLGDFAAFVREAKERGIRVIIDLVVNHTSDQHPWFQEARRDKASKYYNYYIWRKKKPKSPHAEPMFGGEEDSIWSYDEVAKEYYLHRFYSHQPDLNIVNPEVHKEIHNIMGFWLALGVAGFRVDAAHILVQTDQEESKEHFYELLEDMRSYINTHSQDCILLAEATGPPAMVGNFFQEEKRMHMAFNFLINQYFFHAMAIQEAAPLIKGFEKLPPIPETATWLNFLRHHDELTLVDLDKKAQEEIFKVFAPEKDMQIFGHGIRRRLAPMLQNNRQQLELAYSLLFSLPGTPLIQYGAEIGMGDDLSLPGRISVRTAMQWRNTKNGGFSTAPPKDLVRPAISGGEFGYEKVSVMAQQNDNFSLLNWMERLIRIRRQCHEIGKGVWAVLQTGHKAVFAHSCALQATLVAFHNLSDASVSFNAPKIIQEAEEVVELFSDQSYSLPTPKNDKLELGPYGYRWFRLSAERSQDEIRKAVK
ncbi:alpha-amylase family protein [Pontibacter sp. SGAir0037]|uniref:alpha-amylase family protein n=1 Tax=Pontibacter sp. SGAir0037 TaxID=2571030 RepID=UPI0010CD2F17|nr:alpha-amylase family protein [Pontibacter sp. SGAir0037]QCR23874.1 trehalose synthase [Pontibacter sp. SGAir0037]